MCFLLTWQSKYKEDTSATHPILLDNPEAEVHSFPFFTFPYLCMHPCSLFYIYIYIYIYFFFFVPVHPFPFSCFDILYLDRY